MWGVWIEIISIRSSCRASKVAPRVGVWIEILSSLYRNRLSTVAPRVGCVDWNNTGSINVAYPKKSHPMWVRGLKCACYARHRYLLGRTPCGWPGDRLAKISVVEDLIIWLYKDSLRTVLEPACGLNGNLYLMAGRMDRRRKQRLAHFIYGFIGYGYGSSPKTYKRLSVCFNV